MLRVIKDDKRRFPLPSSARTWRALCFVRDVVLCTVCRILGGALRLVRGTVPCAGGCVLCGALVLCGELCFVRRAGLVRGAVLCTGRWSCAGAAPRVFYEAPCGTLHVTQR